MYTMCEAAKTAPCLVLNAESLCNMAPRFVEVVTPVEDGMDALTGAVLRGARLVTWMTSAAVSNMVTHFNSSLHDVECLDASNAANVCAASASLPRGLAMNLILAATATAVVRLIYIIMNTKRIMQLHGRFV
jgi:hypothetical protein